VPQQQGAAQPAGERDQVQERHAREEPGLGGREQDPAKGQENVHMMTSSARVRGTNRRSRPEFRFARGPELAGPTEKNTVTDFHDLCAAVCCVCYYYYNITIIVYVSLFGTAVGVWRDKANKRSQT